MGAGKNWNTSTVLLALAAAIGLTWLISSGQNGTAPTVDTSDPVDSSSQADPIDGPVYGFFDPANAVVSYDEFDQPLPVLDAENTSPGRGDLNKEIRTITLELDAQAEYKALMEQGDSIVYSWKTDGGLVYFDFHAHEADGDPEFFTRYKMGEESTGDSGSILAPYTGQHGWYWLNLSDGPIEITLEVAGFYDEIVEIDVTGS